MSDARSQRVQAGAHTGTAMTLAGHRHDERMGLIVALALHAGLVALLLQQARQAPPPVPDRITVTISDDVGLSASAPEPAARAAPDLAPTTLGAAPPAQAAPAPAKPIASASPPPAPLPLAQPARAAAAQSNARAPAKPLAKQSPAPAGGSRIGSDFLKGLSADTGDARTPPATAIGPALRASLGAAIARQLKPHWSAPQGADGELLVTVLAWDLNADGSLAGTPRVVRQDGITAANRAQAPRHAEQALRAVRLTAPFALPAQYFAAWQHVASFRFDKRLAQ